MSDNDLQHTMAELQKDFASLRILHAQDISKLETIIAQQVAKLESQNDRIRSHVESELGNIGRKQGQTEANIANIEEKTSEVFQTVSVNNNNNEPCHSTRLDRLEQEQKGRNRHMNYMWALISGIIIALVGQWLASKVNPHQSTSQQIQESFSRPSDYNPYYYHQTNVPYEYRPNNQIR